LFLIKGEKNCFWRMKPQNLPLAMTL